MKILGIDIGGSAVKGAPVDTTTGRLLAERHRIATPGLLTPAQMARTVAALAAHFAWKGPIGVGFPGVVRKNTEVLAVGNLHPRFVGCNVGRLFRAATRCPVSLINDADAAGLAEMRFGAGRRRRDTVLLLTFGTGVGSALFCRGALYPNTELGRWTFKGKPVERYVSAAVRKTEGLSWAQWGRRLDGYLHEVETILWPDLIIVGGGVSAKSEKFFPFLHARAKVVPAKFRNRAGIIGAALHAAEHRK